MTKITTKSGFIADIDEELFDDMEFLDLLADIGNGKIEAYPKLIGKILPVEDKKRLYDHVRTENGRVPLSAFERELSDIFEGIKGAKK